MKLSLLKIALGSIVAVVLLILLMKMNASPDKIPDGGKPLRVYCAAGVRLPVEEIAHMYEEEYGYKIDPQYAGSGELMSQFQAARDGDLYLAADHYYVAKGQEEGLLAEDLQIAWQRPVLVVAKDNPHGIESLQDVIDQIEDLRVVLPKPEVAAIGTVAQQQLSEDGAWDILWDHMVTSRETVNAVANDVKSNAADVGIVWDSTAAQYEELLAIPVPQFETAKAEISVSVIARTEQPTRALHFARYLTAHDRGLTHFADHHYDIIDDGDEWADRPEVLIYAGGLNRLAVEEMINEFEKREGVTVLDDYAGCGLLVAKMEGGANPEMYFACDVSFMEMVQDRFYAHVNVSQTAMVIIVPEGNPKNIQSLEDFAAPGLKVGITNPEHSALGALSRDLLKRNGLWEQLDGNFLDLPSTADALTAQVALGAMDAAIVYKANYMNQDHNLDMVAIDDPTALAVQPIAIARDSKHKHLLERLVQQIRSVQSEALFEELGFSWVSDTSLVIPLHEGDTGSAPVGSQLLETPQDEDE